MGGIHRLDFYSGTHTLGQRFRGLGEVYHTGENSLYKRVKTSKLKGK